MTKSEFNTTQFGARMFCKCDGEIYEIKGVDFYKGLIWISKPGSLGFTWEPYEKIELVEA